MQIIFYSAKAYEQPFLEEANRAGHQLRFVACALDPGTAGLADGCAAACIFVNDRADAQTIAALSANGITVLALRCSGFDRVDVPAATKAGIAVVRVPSYSPHAVAEHAVGLTLTLVRKLHRAYNRVREGNFSLDGLMGCELAGKIIGIVGTGRIGATMAGIMLGFGCEVVAADPNPAPLIAAGLRSRGVRYLPLDDLLGASDVVSLHLPLTAASRHLIGVPALARMKRGALLINTSRGGLLDTDAAILALKRGHLGGLGLDVYENEAGLFFSDHSGEVIADDRISRLMTFPNVVVTGHQAFLTHEAMTAIAATTFANIECVERGEACANAVH